METLVLIPTEFGLAPTVSSCENSECIVSGSEDNRRLAVHSEQFIPKGTRFLPFQGTVRLGRLHLESFLPEHDVRYKFGSFDMIQELDNNRRIRQCNWVRFLVGTECKIQNCCFTTGVNSNKPSQDETKCHENMEPNMTAMFLDGQPIFEVIKSILPNTLIVVHFKETFSAVPNGGTIVTSDGNPGDQRNIVEGRATIQDCPLDLSTSLMESPKSPLLSVSSGGRTNKIRVSQRSLLPCEVCGKVFDRPSLLKRHMRTHTGEKPHICEVCNKGFSTSSSLNTHRRIHSGDKPHQCLVCGKRFTASSNLYYHRMTHTKEKPHKCGQCSKSFPTPGDLKAHMYIHSGSWPFRCNVCSRGFSKQTNLRNHLFLHTGDRPYPCKFCGKKFALACNLRAHTKTHHNSEGRVNIMKEAPSEQGGINTNANDNINGTGHEEKRNMPSYKNDKCKIHNTWPERKAKGLEPAKCTISTPEMAQYSCPLLNFHSLDSTESATNFANKRLLYANMNSNNCVMENAARTINSEQLHGISMLGYTNIMEDLWPANSSFVNQCNIPLSVLPAPFNINMPCLTSISLVDLQALLLIQAANIAMFSGGNINFNDAKSLKKEVVERAQSRNILLV